MIFTVSRIKENKGRIESLTIADVDPIQLQGHAPVYLRDRTRMSFTDCVDLEKSAWKIPY